MSNPSMTAPSATRYTTTLLPWRGMLFSVIATSTCATTRSSPKGQIAAGLAVGLLVTAGWFATGYLGADDFNPTPVTSLTFIAPIADSVQYVMLSTGLTLNFGITLVAGVVAGSLLTALVTGRFRLEGYTSPRHMLRSIGGAALMGAGGAMAYGCSIGQGLTGLSTPALASFVAVAGILLGSALGLRGLLRVQPLVSAQDAAQARSADVASRRTSR